MARGKEATDTHPDFRVAFIPDFAGGTESVDATEFLSEVANDCGEVTFAGHPFEYFFLVGVEEVFHHLHPEFGEDAEHPPYGTPQAVYDASRAEYPALLFQLMVAERLGMSKMMIETLRRRIRDAKRAGLSV